MPIHIPASSATHTAQQPPHPQLPAQPQRPPELEDFLKKQEELKDNTKIFQARSEYLNDLQAFSEEYREKNSGKDALEAAQDFDSYRLSRLEDYQKRLDSTEKAFKFDQAVAPGSYDYFSAGVKHMLGEEQVWKNEVRQNMLQDVLRKAENPSVCNEDAQKAFDSYNEDLWKIFNSPSNEQFDSDKEAFIASRRKALERRDLEDPIAAMGRLRGWSGWGGLSGMNSQNEDGPGWDESFHIPDEYKDYFTPGNFRPHILATISAARKEEQLQLLRMHSKEERLLNEFRQGNTASEIPPLQDYTKTFGQEEGVKRYQTLLDERECGNAIKTFAYMRPDEQQSYLRHAMYWVENKDENARLKENFEQALRRDAEKRAKDPAGYLLQTSPELADIYEQLCTSPTPEVCSAFIQQLEAGREARGIVGGPALPHSYTDDMTKNIRRSKPDASIRQLVDLRRNWGEHWPKLRDEIADKVPAVGWAVAAGLDDDMSLNLGKALADPRFTENCKQTLGGDKVNTVNKYCDTYIAEAVTLLKNAGFKREADAVNETARTLALYNVANTSLNPDEAADEIARALLETEGVRKKLEEAESMLAAKEQVENSQKILSGNDTDDNSVIISISGQEESPDEDTLQTGLVEKNSNGEDVKAEVPAQKAPEQSVTEEKKSESPSPMQERLKEKAMQGFQTYDKNKPKDNQSSSVQHRMENMQKKMDEIGTTDINSEAYIKNSAALGKLTEKEKDLDGRIAIDLNKFKKTAKTEEELAKLEIIKDGEWNESHPLYRPGGRNLTGRTIYEAEQYAEFRDEKTFRTFIKEEGKGQQSTFGKAWGEVREWATDPVNIGRAFERFGSDKPSFILDAEDIAKYLQNQTHPKQ